MEHTDMIELGNMIEMAMKKSPFKCTFLWKVKGEKPSGHHLEQSEDLTRAIMEGEYWR